MQALHPCTCSRTTTSRGHDISPFPHRPLETYYRDDGDEKKRPGINNNEELLEAVRLISLEITFQSI